MQKVVLLTTMIFFIGFASASYITGEIRLDEYGFAEFNVQSDVPLNFEGLNFVDGKITGKTDLLTKKNGPIWIFSLDEGNYEDIFLDIYLPFETKKIHSIEGKYFYDTQKEVATVIGKGKLDFNVSYELNESKDYTLLYFAVVLLSLSLIFYFIYLVMKRKNRMRDILPLINDNEQRIIELLMIELIRQEVVRKNLI